jgi:L-asparaginase
VMAGARPLVTMIATGGTISTTTGPTGESAATLSGGDLRARVAIAGIDLVSRDIDRRPSWSLSPTEMASIATTARDLARSTALGGVVITHGTTTLELTAFLCSLFVDAPAPVVLTGAMRRADDAEPDGPRNLEDAIRVAADPGARDLGPLVVFAGRILSAGSVWKAHRTDRDAFVDLAGDVGRVSGATISIDRRAVRRPTFSGRLDDRVRLVKATPGERGDLIEAAARPPARGLVIEALPGVGGIPPDMLPAIRRVAGRMPIVIAPRSPYGTSPEVPTGGTTEPLAGLGLLSAGSLTAEQAVLLLMAALADGEDDRDARRRFQAAASAHAPGSSSRPEMRRNDGA